MVLIDFNKKKIHTIKSKLQKILDYFSGRLVIYYK